MGESLRLFIFKTFNFMYLLWPGVYQILKRQKENEHFLKRIERAVPQYSMKKCNDWYQHHVHFKEGR